MDNKTVTFTSWKYPYARKEHSKYEVYVNSEEIPKQNIIHKFFKIKKCYYIENDIIKFCWNIPEQSRIDITVTHYHPDHNPK